MTLKTECERCNGSGELAYRTRDGSFKCAGPIPDDARGVSSGKCYECNGAGEIGGDDDRL
jgi:hypothetical protein